LFCHAEKTENITNLDINGLKVMKFLSQEQKEVIAKSHGITVESINKRIELWSLINDPDISKPDLVEAQKAWIKIQQGTWPNVNV
tara:strand:- start:175 stop:429 length:255 start_codon:yes stop_codon:yes gene_type:complete